MLEPSTYGGLYLLRRLAPEIPSMIRSRPIFLGNQRVLGKLGFADIDAFPLASILPYRTLVLNRSGNASRPPSIYRLVWRGRYYEVWQRPRKRRDADHRARTPGRVQPARDHPVVPARRRACCESARRRRHARRGTPPARDRRSARRYDAPADVANVSRQPRSDLPRRARHIDCRCHDSDSGSFGVWLGGSFQRSLEIRIDGKSLGEKRHRLNNNGAYTQFGEVELSRGRHEVRLIYTAASLHPGSGGPAFLQLGPLVLGRETADLPVTLVKPQNASSLCGKSLDWLEALRP